jgi:hypothetical protein
MNSSDSVHGENATPQGSPLVGQKKEHEKAL